jgi:hypothetical protein
MGTAALFPPKRFQALQLAVRWEVPNELWQHLLLEQQPQQQPQQQQKQQQQKPQQQEKKLLDPPRSDKISTAVLAGAWVSTNAATSWHYQHPITWGEVSAGLSQPVLWLEGSEEGEQVKVGNLLRLLQG